MTFPGKYDAKYDKTECVGDDPGEVCTKGAE